MIIKKHVTSFGEIIWYIPKEGVIVNDNNIGLMQYHREDGPAYEHEGYCEWVYNGDIHRYDGPAIVETNGSGCNQYWIWNNCIPEDDYPNWLIEMGMDINNLTPEDKLLIDMKWKK